MARVVVKSKFSKTWLLNRSHAWNAVSQVGSSGNVPPSPECTSGWERGS
jgi:hypothetical protein